MTTALEIAEAADIAEKTFYNHFTTKQNLIQELALRATEDTAKRLEGARRFPGSTAARLRHFFESAADGALSGSREFVREVLLELMRMSAVDGTRSSDRARSRRFSRKAARAGTWPPIATSSSSPR